MLFKNLNIADATIEELRETVQGQVILPGDADYDSVRRAWNVSYDQYPAVILVAESTEDIIAGVRYARDAHMGVSVQATGHGVGRAPDDALMIVTSKMTAVQVDAQRQTAWVEAGTKWGKVLEAAQAKGLAPLLGSTTDVGVIGYTLGGGLGWLARKYGLSADSLIRFDFVTADGRLRHVSKDENPDLFWGVRGGGGSLGIVTGMEIKLYPVTTVYAGNLIYPASDAREIYPRYREWIKTLPDEMTCSIVLMNVPNLPMAPEPLRGKSVVMIRGCYAGPLEEGAKLIQQWRDWKKPMVDMFGPMPFSQADTISNDPKDPMPGRTTGLWLRDLDDETIDVLIRNGITGNGLIVAEVRYVGGAVSKADSSANAYGNRDASLLLELVGMATTPQAAEMMEAYMAQIKRQLEGHLTGGVYINFLEGKQRQEQTRQAYSQETYGRLTQLKAKYDPDNLFRFGFHIPPAKK